MHRDSLRLSIGPFDVVRDILLSFGTLVVMFRDFQAILWDAMLSNGPGMAVWYDGGYVLFIPFLHTARKWLKWNRAVTAYRKLSPNSIGNVICSYLCIE